MALDRRQFLWGSARGAAAVAACGVLGRVRLARAMPAGEIVRLDGVAQAAAITKGELSALEVVEAAIAQIERLNPKINAVVANDFERARTRAKANQFQGPFAGVPFLVKDLSDFHGLKTTKASRVLMDNKVAERTDVYVQACENAGMNVVGKSNTPEFGMSCTTESLALGPCLNPWDFARSAGGSSGGAAAAVATGMVPIAQGSDSGGSIRIPASCCGVFGLKPSRGRLVGSNDAFGFGSRGVLSRSVRDTAYALMLTQRPQPPVGLEPISLVNEPCKRRLKIGYYLKGEYGVEPATDVATAVNDAIKLCKELGHDVQECKIGFDAAVSKDYHLIRSERNVQTVAELEKKIGRKLTDQDVEPPLLASVEKYHEGWKEEVDGANKRVRELSARLNDEMRQYDVVLCPALRTAPPLLGEFSPLVPLDLLIERMISYVAYTVIFNVTGMPAMSVPLAWNEQGLPIGVQFTAKTGDERTLLELAYQLEEARPWREKWPACAANV